MTPKETFIKSITIDSLTNKLNVVKTTYTREEDGTISHEDTDYVLKPGDDLTDEHPTVVEVAESTWKLDKEK